jgi:hypothetical protein
MSADTVTVRRLTVHCAVPRNHPAPDRVRARLDDAAGAPLRAALAEILAPLASLGSDAVVIIRRLEVSFDLDTSRETPDLARRWAARLGAQLAEALRPGARTNGMVWFPDEAHLLGRFVADAAAGHADGKWYYRRYDGFAALALPARVRSALDDEPARGLAALATLSTADLGLVLDVLGAREARRVVEAASAGDADEAALDDAAAALAAAAPAWREGAFAARSPWMAALALVAQAARALPVTRLSAAARLAASIAGWFGADAPAARSASALAEPQPSLAPLMALSPSRRAAIERALDRPRGSVEATPAPVVEHTSFGGMLLLLPHLAELPIEATWNDADERALARLAVLARCAGVARAAGVEHDPLLRRLVGIASDERRSLDEWLDGAGAQLADFAVHLDQQARRHATAVELGLARSGADSLLVHVALPAGDWARLEPLTAAGRESLRAASPTLATTRAHTRMLHHLGAPSAGDDTAKWPILVAAQQVLRGFARRLPGFDESSPAYLYDNFLAFASTVEVRNGRTICRTGRPPLAALLGFTGALRGRIDVPWLEPIELYGGG